MHLRILLGLLTIALSSTAVGEEASRISSLIETLQHGTDTSSRMDAAKRLGESARLEAVAPLVEMLGESSRPVRWAAIEALGELRRREAVPALLDYLSRPEAYRWGTILTVNALAALRDRRALAPLLGVLDESGDPIIQRTVIVALGTLGNSNTVSEVMPFLTSHREWVQRAAQSTLTELTEDRLHGPVPNGYEEWRRWYAHRESLEFQE